jgi:hypothetical protein
MERENIQWIEVREDQRERILQLYKRGEDHFSSGFQKGDEVRQEACFSEFRPLCKEEWESFSPIGDCRKKRDWSGDFSKSNEALYKGVFSPPEASDQRFLRYHFDG